MHDYTEVNLILKSTRYFTPCCLETRAVTSSKWKGKVQFAVCIQVIGTSDVNIGNGGVI